MIPFVIVHGKSEYQICSFIRTELRLQMEIIKDAKSSIQITSLIKFLTRHKFLKSERAFKKEYSDYLQYDKKGKCIIPNDFKIYIIMDTDDCTNEQRQAYINGNMFENYWAKEYIIPIFNTSNLESVLKKSGIKYKKKHIKEQKKEYIEIFPTEPKYRQNNSKLDLRNFQNNLQKCQTTNMENFIEFCLTKAENNPYFKTL